MDVKADDLREGAAAAAGDEFIHDLAQIVGAEAGLLDLNLRVPAAEILAVPGVGVLALRLDADDLRAHLGRRQERLRPRVAKSDHGHVAVKRIRDDGHIRRFSQPVAGAGVAEYALVRRDGDDLAGAGLAAGGTARRLGDAGGADGVGREGVHAEKAQRRRADADGARAFEKVASGDFLVFHGVSFPYRKISFFSLCRAPAPPPAACRV